MTTPQVLSVLSSPNVCNSSQRLQIVMTGLFINEKIPFEKLSKWEFDWKVIDSEYFPTFKMEFK